MKSNVTLPAGFTDKVMGRIELQMEARARRKSAWMVVLYSLSGIIGLSAVLFTLNFFNVISFEGIAGMFKDFNISLELKPDMAALSSLRNSFTSAASSFSSFASSHSLTLIIGFEILLLFFLGEILSSKKRHTTV